MLVTALTLMGYSVGMSLASSAIMKSCVEKGSVAATERIANLPEDHDPEAEVAIINEEQKKATFSFAAKTAVLGVAAGAVATGIIYNFDCPDMFGTSNEHHHGAINNNVPVETVPEIASADDTATATINGETTTIGGVEVATF